DIYYQAFPNDRRLNKGLVYGIYLLQLILTGSMIHDTYITYGSGFGDLSSIFTINSAPYLVPIIGGLSKSSLPLILVLWAYSFSEAGFAAQSFYAHRIHTLSKTRIIPCIWFAGSAVTDILIAGCMTYYLTKYDTGFRQTHELISRLIRLIIETGTMTGTYSRTSSLHIHMSLTFCSFGGARNSDSICRIPGSHVLHMCGRNPAKALFRCNPNHLELPNQTREHSRGGHF
ncbi:hypothetical protein FB45DRAFT_750686, partial [Roridomyces roridus]